MPTTEHKRDDRLQVIHKCLKTFSNNWTVKKILEKVNRHLEINNSNTVSARTIAADLIYLELKKFAPIVIIKRGKNVFYTYGEDFELNQPVITMDENVGLSLANHVLKQLKGFPLTKELEAILGKLQNKFEVSDENKCIFFEESPALKNIHLLQDLFECIKEKTVLKITYRHFKATAAVEKIIYPYCLKQYNQRWFLFGYDAMNKRIDNSPLDRIESVKPTAIIYEQHLAFDPEEYFKDIVGVTKPDAGKLQTIIFRMSKERAAYINTKAIHPSQLLIKEYRNGEMAFMIKVIINKELISSLLSFGSDLVIEKPTALKSQIIYELERALNKY